MGDVAGFVEGVILGRRRSMSAEVVERIRAMRDTGMTFAEIAAALNAAGVADAPSRDTTRGEEVVALDDPAGRRRTSGTIYMVHLHVYSANSKAI